MPNGDIDGVGRFVFYYVFAVLFAPGGDCLKSVVGVVSIVGCVPNGDIHGVDRFVCDGVLVVL